MPGLRLTTTRYPKYKIYVPALRSYRQFEGGLLDLDESDPAFEHVKAIATAKPFITVRAITGETPGGNTASVQVKSAAAFVCEACNPAQPFDTEAELAVHTAALHAVRPILAEDGSDTAATDARPPRVRQGVSGTRTVTRKATKKK